MALTTEQILLLNNLMYIKPQNGTPFQSLDGFDGYTVGEWLDSMDLSNLAELGMCDNFITGEDWQNIITAVRQDETIMNMSIAVSHIDTEAGGGNGRSAVFISEETNDAVVVFKGSESPSEWTDNFNGAISADTTQQQNALEWYQDIYRECGLEDYHITITGHSKGGNKAKYITVLDDMVDECVSFDGQGFSDDFMTRYAENIAENQGKIENHNVDSDYVNILLNDIGNTTYYKGYDYGKGGFLESHCPNTFLKISPDGSIEMTVNPDGQTPGMKALDEFFNSYLRSISDEEQKDAMHLINAILDNAFSFDENTSTADMLNVYLQMMADEEYSDDLSYLVAYLIKYEQSNPEFADQINDLLGNIGLGEFTKYVDAVKNIINFEYELPGGIKIDFNLLYSMLTGEIYAQTAINLFTLPGMNWLSFFRTWLATIFGIHLTTDEILNLIRIIGKICSNLHEIDINETGEDIVIASTVQPYDSSQSCHFHIDLRAAKNAVSDLQKVEQKLNQIETEIDAEISRLDLSMAHSVHISRSLSSAQKKIQGLQQKTTKMTNTLDEIIDLHKSVENQLSTVSIRK